MGLEAGGKRMAEGKRGAPKGHVGNPLGKNQYVERKGEGTRTTVITVRVPDSTKEKIREAATLEKVSISEWISRLIEAQLNA